MAIDILSTIITHFESVRFKKLKFLPDLRDKIWPRKELIVCHLNKKCG